MKKDRVLVFASILVVGILVFSSIIISEDADAKTLKKELKSDQPREVEYVVVRGDTIEINPGDPDIWHGGWFHTKFERRWSISNFKVYKADGRWYVNESPSGLVQYPSWLEVRGGPNSKGLYGTATTVGTYDAYWVSYYYDWFKSNTPSVEPGGAFSIKVIEKVMVKLDWGNGTYQNLEGRDSVSLPKSKTEDGRILTGWNTEGDGTGTAYAKGAEIKIRGTTNLYAMWETEITHTNDLIHEVDYNDSIDIAIENNIGDVSIISGANPLGLQIGDGHLKGILDNAEPGMHKTGIKIKTDSQSKDVFFTFYVLPYASVPVTNQATLGVKWHYTQSMNPNDAQFRIEPVRLTRTDTSEVLSLNLIEVLGNSMSIMFPAEGNYQIDYRMVAINNTNLKPVSLAIKVEVIDPTPVAAPPAADGIRILPTQNPGEYDFSALNPRNYQGFYWEFGDGSISSEAKPTHVYNRPGVYAVKLTLTPTSEDYSAYEFTVNHVYFEEKNPPTAAFLKSPLQWMTEVNSGTWDMDLGGASWLTATEVAIGDKRYMHLTGTCPDDISLVGMAYKLVLTDGERTERWTLTVYSAIPAPILAKFSYFQDGATVTVKYLGDEWGVPWVDWGDSLGESYRKIVTPSVSHKYASSGWYTIRVYVEVDGFRTPDSYVVNIPTAETPGVPGVSIVQPADLKIKSGGEVSINISTVPVGAVISIQGPEWLKVEGHTITGKAPEDSRGTYSVKVTATYGGKSADTEFYITVDAGQNIPRQVPIALGAVGIVMLIATLVTRSPRMLLLTVVVLAAIGGAFLI